MIQSGELPLGCKLFPEREWKPGNFLEVEAVGPAAERASDEELPSSARTGADAGCIKHTSSILRKRSIWHEAIVQSIPSLTI